jgi:hypothetical protein
MGICLLVTIYVSKKNLKINSQPALRVSLIDGDAIASCLACKIHNRTGVACLGSKSCSSRRGFVPPFTCVTGRDPSHYTTEDLASLRHCEFVQNLMAFKFFQKLS